LSDAGHPLKKSLFSSIAWVEAPLGIEVSRHRQGCGKIGQKARDFPRKIGELYSASAISPGNALKMAFEKEKLREVVEKFFRHNYRR
jgi:hypothetical protein